MSLPTVQDILADFPGWALLDMSHGDQSSGQGSGVIIVKQLRDPLWELHAESKLLKPNMLRFWKAKLDGLNNGKKYFLGYDSSSFFPAAYPNGSWPTGSSFSGTTAAIHSIGSDGVSLSLSGLPAGFTGTIGDMLQVTYGGSPPSDLALFRAVETFTADGSGQTSEFEVRGTIPAGIAVSDAVSVKKPACHMIIVPDSVKITAGLSGWGSIVFDGIQVPTI
jgi:hypothetical protein